ncbi:MAG: helix-turn-helix transcriptional regulator, partial [Streptomycetaceae bacterium]|nr:helix-turn-helix transcriptional regulator [Streptomycetaceae bacterium]
MTGKNNSGGALSGIEALLAAVAAGTVLPPPVERVRLREAAGLTEAAVAQALGVRVPSIKAWEAGRAEPTGERLQAYRKLLDGLAQHYPAPVPAAPAPAPRTVAAPQAAPGLVAQQLAEPRALKHPPAARLARPARAVKSAAPADTDAA